jgi:TRAP-type mannitol/chloroaromatic compound transport system permease small subunit
MRPRFGFPLQAGLMMTAITKPDLHKGDPIMLQQLMKVCDGINEWTGRTVAWLVWIVMILCVFEVITRRIFNAPNIWSYDVINVFYAVNFMLLGGYTLLKRGHVSVDIFSVRLSQKTQSLLQIITYLIFFFPFFIVLFYVGWKTATVSWMDLERTSIGLPFIMPVMKTAMPVAALLLIIQGIPEVTRSIITFLKEGQPDA